MKKGIFVGFNMLRDLVGTCSKDDKLKDLIEKKRYRKLILNYEDNGKMVREIILMDN